MELWRTADDSAERPKVMCSLNLAVALGLHVGAFVLFWLYAVCHGLFNKEEEIIPIDLTVVVNENLDGVENEPPPLQDPEPPPPPPPPPKPQPKPKVKKPDPPKELEKVVTNVVEKVEKKEEKKEPEKKQEPEKKKEPEKKPEKPEKPEKPKKTKEQIKAERIKAMRQSAKAVKGKTVTIKVDAPSGNGRTDRKTLSDAEIRKLLNMGYKPGTSEQLATSDLQLGYSLIKMAFEAKWDQPPWTDTLRPMTIRVWFGGGGRVVRYVLESSSGDARADQSIKSAASRVGSVPGLPSAFIDKYKSSGVPIRFTVKPQ